MILPSVVQQRGPKADRLRSCHPVIEDLSHRFVAGPAVPGARRAVPRSQRRANGAHQGGNWATPTTSKTRSCLGSITAILLDGGGHRRSFCRDRGHVMAPVAEGIVRTPVRCSRPHEAGAAEAGVQLGCSAAGSVPPHLRRQIPAR